MNASGSRRTVVRVVSQVALAALGFVYMYPFLWMVSGSLKDRSEFFGNGLSLLPQRLLWENYGRAWERASFGIYFKNTVFVTVVTTLLVVLLTSLAGYALARSRFPGRKLVIGAVLVTMFLPRGYTIVPIFQLVRDLGLLNSLWAVILVNTATSMVFNTFLFMGYFNTLSREIEEAAIIDGARPLDVYSRIAMPLARPMIGTVMLFEFIDNWNSFFIPLVFTLSRPDLRTVAVGMYAFFGQQSTEWTLMCAAATMSLLPTLVFFFLLQRMFVEGVAGAIRG